MSPSLSSSITPNLAAREFLDEMRRLLSNAMLGQVVSLHVVRPDTIVFAGRLNDQQERLFNRLRQLHPAPSGVKLTYRYSYRRHGELIYGIDP